ncbi:hypothetical protein F5887DRAFT_1257031 [Amanita rubescens]|nr:hypothetical protein F5887DRAFT_1257031 [Amanita rubescens]
MVAAKTSIILAAIVLGATSTYAVPTRFNGDLARRATPEVSFLAARQLEGAAAPADSATGVTTAPKPGWIHRAKNAILGHHGGDANTLAARQFEGAAATAGSATAATAGGATDVATTPPKQSWFHHVKNALTGHRGGDANKEVQHHHGTTTTTMATTTTATTTTATTTTVKVKVNTDTNTNTTVLRERKDNTDYRNRGCQDNRDRECKDNRDRECKDNRDRECKAVPRSIKQRLPPAVIRNAAGNVTLQTRLVWRMNSFYNPKFADGHYRKRAYEDDEFVY